MPVDERYRRQVELLVRSLRKLAQLDERERSAMVRRVEAALTDKIDRGPLPVSTGYSVRGQPTGHAGGKWLARYASALGGNLSLEPAFGARPGRRNLAR